jgi:predicted site-specific integrase-resolvase
VSAPRSRPWGPLLALGYVRVSTAGQVDSGAGFDAQRAALESEAARQGWTLEIVTDAGLSGPTMRRPALTEALAQLDRGDADVLIAAKLDRVSRSVKDFAALLERAQRKRWRIVLLDLGDTSSASGEMVANMIASAAQYERRLIGQRTRKDSQPNAPPGYDSAARPSWAARSSSGSCASARAAPPCAPSPRDSPPTECAPPAAEINGPPAPSRQYSPDKTPQDWLTGHFIVSSSGDNWEPQRRRCRPDLRRRVLWGS